MRRQRSALVLALRSNVHTHRSPWRILGMSNNYFREDGIVKYEISIKKQKTTNITGNERMKIQNNFVMKEKILLRDYENKYPTKETNKERTINWCEESKLNRLTLLNYTERGKKRRKFP